MTNQQPIDPMTSIRRFLIAFVWLIAAALLLERPALAQSDPRPNVLVVIVDDMSWEELSAGFMPTVSTLAPLGRTFTRFYGCPVCSPSRAGLFSGTFPHRHFIGSALNLTDASLVGLPSTADTLPEALAVAGYATALFGKAHVSGLAGTNPLEQARVHGFETWRAGVGSNIIGPESHFNWTRVDDGESSTTTTYSTTAIVSECLAWWSSTDEPKFAVLAPAAPHSPFDAPPAALLPPNFVVGTNNRAKYEAALLALDSSLSSLLSVIDISNTYVILISDNGSPNQVPPPLGISPGYKPTVYQGGVNVPCIIWGPSVVPGVDDTLAQTVDLPRTILDLIGIATAMHPITGAPMSFVDSISFEPSLHGIAPGASRRQYVYVSRFAPNNGTSVALNTDNWAVIREDGWKLVQEGSVFRIFNLSNDPWEQVGFGPMGPGLAGVTADLLNFRSAVLGVAWPY